MQDQEALSVPNELNLLLCKRLFTTSSLICGVVFLSALTILLFYRACYWVGFNRTEVKVDYWELNALGCVYLIVCCGTGYLTKKILWFTCDYFDFAFPA